MWYELVQERQDLRSQDDSFSSTTERATRLDPVLVTTVTVADFQKNIAFDHVVVEKKDEHPNSNIVIFSTCTHTYLMVKSYSRSIIAPQSSDDQDWGRTITSHKHNESWVQILWYWFFFSPCKDEVHSCVTYVCEWRRAKPGIKRSRKCAGHTLWPSRCTSAAPFDARFSATPLTDICNTGMHFIFAGRKEKSISWKIWTQDSLCLRLVSVVPQSL